MNAKTVLRLGALLIVMLLVATVSAFAQLSTAYVDVTNGSDAYTGANPTNNPAGTGPKATIGAGVSALANNGTLVLFAGTYMGLSGGDEDIDINSTTYTRLTSGLTIELRQLNANNEANVSGGSFIFNITGGVLNIRTTSGTEYLNLTGGSANMTLTAGTIDIPTQSTFRIRSGATITINGTAGFSNQAPQKGTSLNLTYTGGSSITAGPESNYGSYGTGTLTVNKTAGTSVTFPNAMTFGNDYAPITISSGNATFNGNIVLGAVGSSTGGVTSQVTGDIIVSGTSSATFNGTVTLHVSSENTTDRDISVIQNDGSGTVTLNGAVEWKAGYNFAAGTTTFAAVAGTSMIRNTSSGTISFASTVTLSTTDITANAIITIAVNVNNTASGTVSLAQAIAAPTSFVTTSTNTRAFSVTATNAGSMSISGTLRGSVTNSGAGTLNVNNASTISGNLVNSSTGTVNIQAASTVSGALTNSSTGTVNVQAANTVGGILTNNGGGTIALGTNVLTFSGAVAHLTNTGTISSSAPGELRVSATGASSFNGGSLSRFAVTGSGTVTFQTNAVSATNISLSAGGLTVAISATVSGDATVTGGTLTVNDTRTLTVNSFTQSGGTVVLGAGASGTLDVNNDFSRTGGTFTANAGSLLTFTGTTAQSFNGGSLLQVSTLTFNNTAGTITLGQSVRVSGTATISAFTNVALGTLNIILNANDATIVNSGSYTATGGGGVVLGGLNTVSGGVAIPTSNPAKIQGGGTYSYITVDVGSNTAVVSGSSNVKWNGVLNLRSGTLDVAAAIDFGPTGSTASIVRNVVSSPGITTTAGTFNAGNVAYDLEYTGTLVGDVSTGSELNATPANVRTWTVSVDGDANDDNTPELFIQIPANGLNFGGTLIVNQLAAVRITADAAANDVFELSGTNVNHVVKGILTTVPADGDDRILISGATSTLTGSTATNDAATVGNIRVSSTSSCTITSIKSFSGTFTSETNSVVSLGMGSTTATQVITGAVSLGGSSFTLTTNVEARAGVSHSAGSLNVGAFNLQLTTAGNYSQSGGSNTSTGGFLVMNRSGASLTLSSTLLRLRVLANTTLAAAATVSDNLEIGASNAAFPVLTLGANNLTYSGTSVVFASNAGAGADVVDGTGAGTDNGDLILTNAAVTVTTNNTLKIEELTYNPTGGVGTLTLASDVAATQRTFEITDALTLSAGTIATGIHILTLTGDATASLAFTASANTSVTSTTGTTTGYLDFNFAAAAAFTPPTAGTLTIQNLRISAAATATNPFTVSNRLDLTAAALTVDASELTLSDGITIIRRLNTATLANAATFAGTSNVQYVQADGANAVITTGNELTASVNNLTINNQEVTAAEDDVVLNKNVTVNGTLFLTDGQLDEGAFALTMASGSTINRSGGTFEGSDAPTVTSYNLTYSTGGAVTSTGQEFLSGTGITVSTLTVEAASTVLSLHAARTVGNVTLNSSGGGINLNAFALTATGNVTVTDGSFSGAGTAANLILAGSALQTLTVPSAGSTLPTLVNLRLSNSAGFTLTGGNLTVNSTLAFVNGVMSTTSPAIVILAGTVDRTGLTGTSHINGSIRRAIPSGSGGIGRYEYPVGSATKYRPFTVTFTTNVITATNITVTHVDASPAGAVGLPLDGGNNVRIGSYPDFYWLVSATTSLGLQSFDVELVGTNLGRPFNVVSDLRIIKRFDGSADVNSWSLQGTGTGYDNILEVPTPGDSVVTVRVSGSAGGIVTQGARFSIGIPTRGPLFTATQATAAVDENATLRLAYYADPQDVGESITYSLSTSPSITTNAPAIAKKSTAAVDSGIVTWTPSYTQSGTYTLTVSASDGQYSTTTTTSVTVVNVNRAPDLTAVADQTAQDGQQLSVTLAATDADNDALTFSFVSITPAASVNPAVTTAGLLTWTPGFADAAKTFTIRVAVADSVTPTPGADSLNITASVSRSVRRGDASLNGSITAFDASLVLQYTVGLYTPASADSAKFAYTADASAFGGITAFDASRILLWTVDSVANPITSIKGGGSEVAGHLAKSAVGSLDWGSARGGESAELLSLPLVLSGASDVYSAQIAMMIPSGVEVKAVAMNLPSDWMVMHNVVNGELKIAMAGATPVSARELGMISFRIADKEARFSPVATVMLNENVASTLTAKMVQAVPTEFALSQNYPNPFNPSTKIKYQLPLNAKVVIEIYNITGQKVRTLVNADQEAGYYTVEWNGLSDLGQRLASGMYLYRIHAGSFVRTNKMMMLK